MERTGIAKCDDTARYGDESLICCAWIGGHVTHSVRSGENARLMTDGCGWAIFFALNNLSFIDENAST